MHIYTNTGPKIELNDILNENIKKIVTHQSNEIKQIQQEIDSINETIHTAYLSLLYQLSIHNSPTVIQLITEMLDQVLSLEKDISLIYSGIITIQSRFYIKYATNIEYPGSYDIHTSLIAKNIDIITFLKDIRYTYTTISIIIG